MTRQPPLVPLVALASLLALPARDATAQARAAEAIPAPQAIAACEVWARELSFADSVARHDGAAFAEHVHARGVFGAGQPPEARRVGREAIVAGWAPIVAGQHVTIRWYPTSTVAAPDGRVVWSSGPALVVARRGERGTPEFTHSITGFRSVWVRDDDGAWRVLFDDGEEPREASPEEVAAFEAGRRTDCPYRP